MWMTLNSQCLHIYWKWKGKNEKGPNSPRCCATFIDLLCVSVSGVFHKQIGTLKQTQLMVKGIKNMTESWAGLSGDMLGSVCTWHHLWPFENASRQRLWDCECGVWRLCCFEAIWQKFPVIPTIISHIFWILTKIPTFRCMICVG